MVDHPFLGTWRLVSVVNQTEDGNVSQPFGDHPHGYISYSADGYMSVQIMRAGRPNFQSPDLFGGDREEKARAMETFLAYCGTYEIQGNVVVHHIEASLFPNWTGIDQRRIYQFEGRRLTLSSEPQVFQGKQRTTIVVWERA